MKQTGWHWESGLAKRLGELTWIFGAIWDGNSRLSLLKTSSRWPLPPYAHSDGKICISPRLDAQYLNPLALWMKRHGHTISVICVQILQQSAAVSHRNQLRSIHTKQRSIYYERHLIPPAIYLSLLLSLTIFLSSLFIFSPSFAFLYLPFFYQQLTLLRWLSFHSCLSFPITCLLFIF